MKKKNIVLHSLFLFLFFLSYSFIHSETVPDHWEKIEQKIKDKDWEGAKLLVEKAASEYPDEKIIRIIEVGVLRNSGNPQESVKKARVALLKWPDADLLKEELSYSLCSIFDSILQKGKFNRELISKESYSIAEEAFQLKDSEWSTILYGISLQLQKRYDESIKHFEEGTKRYPNSKHFSELIGDVYLEKASDALNENRFQEAIRLAEKSSQYIPGHEKINIIKALAWFHIDLEKSLPYFQKAVETEPSREAHYQNLSYVYYHLSEKWIREKNQKKLSEALVDVKKYSALPGKQGFGFLVTWNRVTNLDENFNELISFLKDKSEKYPNDVDLKVFYGSVLNKLGMKQKRNNPKLAEQIQTEANYHLREGMKLFEEQNPNRATLLGIKFPLDGRIIVAAPFDGGGTHSGFEKYSYDLLHIDANGSPIKPGTSGANNSDFYAFGQTVYAVADGTVSSIHEGYQDNSNPGEIHFGDGNEIQIQHENGLFSYYVHLRKGSIKVTKGQKLKKGDPIAEVGNSGMSYAPHLHFTIVTAEGISTYYEFEKLKVYAGSREMNTSKPFERGWIVEK